jgi:putative transcriptional regulator
MLTNRLSRLMGERRVTVAEAARATGLSRTTLHDLYHDRSTRIDLATLDRLCGYFHVDTQAILEWQPESPSTQGAQGSPNSHRQG